VLIRGGQEGREGGNKKGKTYLDAFPVDLVSVPGKNRRIRRLRVLILEPKGRDGKRKSLWAWIPPSSPLPFFPPSFPPSLPPYLHEAVAKRATGPFLPNDPRRLHLTKVLEQLLWIGRENGGGREGGRKGGKDEGREGRCLAMTSAPSSCLSLPSRFLTPRRVSSHMLAPPTTIAASLGDFKPRKRTRPRQSSPPPRDGFLLRTRNPMSSISFGR
jgi:hypothetical protein